MIIMQIHMHGSDFTSLHQYMPKEHLPQDFGGQLSVLDDYNAKYLFPGLTYNKQASDIEF